MTEPLPPSSAEVAKRMFIGGKLFVLLNVRVYSSQKADCLRDMLLLSYAGCFFLPWLWIVNLYYFRKLLARQDCPPEVKRWTNYSKIGTLVMTLLFATWVIIFQVTWRDWGSGLLVVPVDDGSW